MDPCIDHVGIRSTHSSACLAWIRASITSVPSARLKHSHTIWLSVLLLHKSVEAHARLTLTRICAPDAQHERCCGPPIYRDFNTITSVRSTRVESATRNACTGLHSDV
jgi:hypothetical protein